MSKKNHPFFFSLLILVTCLSSALGAGYTCSSAKKYTSCNSGYYLSSNSCLSCPSGYTSAANNKSGQTSCYKSCTVSCTQGACPSNAKCSYGTDNATGTQYYGGSCNAVQGTCSINITCNSGYYKTTDNKCEKCPANSYCSGNAKSSCPNTYPYSDAGASSENSCYKNATKSGSQVTPSTVPTNCSKVTAWNECVVGSCQYRIYKDGTEGTCTGATNCNKTVKTVEANAGYYVDGTSCKACGGNNYYCTGGTAIRKTVSSGYYSTGGTDTTRTGQSQCKAGTYCSGGVKADCAAGTYSGTDGATSCSACSGATQYQNETGKTSCKTVSSGYYKNGNTAQAQCTKGTYCSGGNKYNCSAGTYSNTDGATSCTSCSGATYQDGTGATSCKSCPTAESGWTSGSGTGWTAVTSCFETRTPANCASGTIKKNATNTTTWGTASVTVALSADKKYYVNGTSCSSCPSGYPESAGGAINDSSCYTVKTETGTCTNAAVPDGCKTVSAYNSVTPTTCTWKSYKNGSGTKCTPAACTNTVKSVTAKSGYYTSGTSCTKCATGYTSADGNTGTTASGACYISVAAGKYLTTANGTTTANCANWTYKAAHIVYQGNTSSCTGCPTLTNGWSKKDSSGTSWSAESSCVQIQTPTNCSSGSVKQVASNGAWGVTQSDTALSAKNNYYVSGTSCPACSGIQSGAYPSSDGGQIDSTKCYTSVKVTGNCTDEATPAGCASATRTAGTKTECTWKKYSNGSGTACTPTSCTNSISSVSANANHYVLNKTCPACPEDYPYSSGGAISEGKCYTTATESKACTNASTPDGCASATYTTKPASTCQWTNYKDGSGSKCNPTACTNPVATVKAKAGYYAATNATSCTACPNGGTSDAGATAETACYKTCDAKTITGGTASNVQTKQNWNGSSYPVCTYSVNCDAGYGADGNNTASPSCTQCPAGQYSAGKTNTCKNCAAGSYSASKGASSCSACDGATKYQNEAGKTSCKDVSKGYYKSSNSAQSQCPANYQSGAGASTQAACQTSCAAGTRVATANAACTVVDGNNYMAAHTVNYGSVSGAATACKSGYTITGSTQQDHDDQTDCKITCAAGKYIAVAGAGCVQCPAKSYCAGGTKNQTETLAATGCPTAYPNSDAGATAITLCYSNNRSRAWDGKQNEPTKPDGCASMVTAACSLDACSYSVYSNSTGTADGNHHEGCTTNNAPCTKSITSVTATTGHYVNNKTCPACTNKPANSSYTGAGTTATNCTWACDNNYGKTYDSQCIKICTAGITKLRAGDNVTVQLYDTKHTTPSIVIQNGDKMCYGNLIEGNGKGALNVSYKNTTYHSVN